MLIRRGSRGAVVKSFQQFLIDSNHLNDVADGIAGPKTVAGIKSYQRSKGLTADGMAGRHTQLAASADGWQTDKPKAIQASDEIKRASETTGISERMLMAFERTESGGNPRAIRFEPHLFVRLKPELKGKIPFTPGPKRFSITRGETGRAAFERAYKLDAAAAVKSSSWGLFQVLGGHLIKVHGSPSAGVVAFDKSPRLVSFELVAAWFNANPAAVTAANNLDWEGLVRRYNGPGNVPAYSKILKSHYDKLSNTA